MIAAATLDPPTAAWGLAARHRQARRLPTGTLRAFLRTPEALDLSDAEIAARLGVTPRAVDRAWRRHYAQVDARPAARRDRSVAGAARGDAPALDGAELAARIAARARPGIERGAGPANTGERDFEVDLPDFHGWWAVPDSRTPAERARVAGLPRREVAADPGARPDLRRACRLLLAEFRVVRRRHRRLRWAQPAAEL